MTNNNTLKMDAEILQEVLMELLYASDEVYENMSDNIQIQTFEEAGVLTNNKGLVVNWNGKKFHITISE